MEPLCKNCREIEAGCACGAFRASYRVPFSLEVWRTRPAHIVTRSNLVQYFRRVGRRSYTTPIR